VVERGGFQANQSFTCACHYNLLVVSGELEIRYLIRGEFAIFIRVSFTFRLPFLTFTQNFEHYLRVPATLCALPGRPLFFLYFIFAVGLAMIVSYFDSTSSHDLSDSVRI
jgi:hypothetical protein